MSTLIDLIGQKFGRLIVIQRAENDKRGTSRWLCKCSCGNKIIVRGDSLKGSRAKSCGCLNIEKFIQRSTKHGHSRRKKITKIYRVWDSMIQRCTNPNRSGYKDYGGRGITVCDEWLHSFPNFKRDNPGWKPGLTIERRDKNGNYCPENCKWATRKEQQRNTRRNRLITYKGKTQCLIEWAEEYNISYMTLWCRLYRYNWLTEKALLKGV